MNKNLILETTCVLCRESDDNKTLWFVVKPLETSSWELPHVIVRKGESSVRAALRVIGQQAAINSRVLEEVGRKSGVVTLNGKTVPKKVIYYLMLAKHVGNETIGFFDSAWCDYTKASRRLTNKTDLSMLKTAREVLRTWKKQHTNYNFDDDKDFPEDELEDAEFQEEI
ncbi:MAG: hypothetical protein NZM26_00655 [Patescibacteria group bacterium]|nr:hypothetical protein [Patescibacteria group bacterium]